MKSRGAPNMTMIRILLDQENSKKLNKKNHTVVLFYLLH